MADRGGELCRQTKSPSLSLVLTRILRTKILSLNSATVEDFEKLPHIGKATAEKIVAHRSAQGPFKEKSDLLRVDGISIARYKQIESRLTVP